MGVAEYLKFASQALNAGCALQIFIRPTFGTRTRASALLCVCVCVCVCVLRVCAVCAVCVCVCVCLRSAPRGPAETGQSNQRHNKKVSQSVSNNPALFGVTPELVTHRDDKTGHPLRL